MANEEILEKIKNTIELESNKISYKFMNKSAEEKRKWYDDMIISLSKDPTITPIVNHTKFPNDVIVAILNYKGIEISSIYEIDEVDCEYIDDGINVGYNFKVSLPKLIEKTVFSINIDLNKESKEENNKCE